MPNEENLVPFQKGDDPRRNIKGRPKSVYRELNKYFSKDEIMSMFGTVAFFTREQTQSILDDPDAGMLELVVCQAYMKGASKGDFRYIAEIISHVLGKPTERSEAKILSKILVEYVNPNNTTLPSSPGSAEDTEGEEEV